MIGALFFALYCINKKRHKYQAQFDAMDLLEEALRISESMGDRRKGAIFLLKNGQEVQSPAFQNFLTEIKQQYSIKDNELL